MPSLTLSTDSQDHEVSDYHWVSASESWQSWLLKSYIFIVLNETISQCQVVRVNKTSSETAHDAASPKYLKIKTTTPTPRNNATGQHILTVWTGYMSSRRFQWNNCSGLPKTGLACSPGQSQSLPFSCRPLLQAGWRLWPCGRPRLISSLCLCG